MKDPEVGDVVTIRNSEYKWHDKSIGKKGAIVFIDENHAHDYQDPTTWYLIRIEGTKRSAWFSDYEIREEEE